MNLTPPSNARVKGAAHGREEVFAQETSQAAPREEGCAEEEARPGEEDGEEDANPANSTMEVVKITCCVFHRNLNLDPFH